MFRRYSAAGSAAVVRLGAVVVVREAGFLAAGMGRSSDWGWLSVGGAAYIEVPSTPTTAVLAGIHVLLFWFRRAAWKDATVFRCSGSPFAAFGTSSPSLAPRPTENDRDDLAGSHAGGRGRRSLVRRRARLGLTGDHGGAFDIRVLCGGMEHSLGELLAAAAEPGPGAASATCAGART